MRRWRGARHCALCALPAAILVCGLALRLAALGRPFWMDESFSSALATQSPPTVVKVCRQDVHPPAYFLLLREWNRLCLALAPGAPPEAPMRLVDFRVSLLATAGTFEWADREGGIHRNHGIFPEEWKRWPLAPLWALRLLSVLFAFGAAGAMARVGKRLAPERPEIALAALALFAFSGFTLTWDTVIRSYSASGFLVAALTLAGLWGAQSGRWRAAAPAMTALAAFAFLTNYVTALHFPGIALAAWIWGGLNRRNFAWIVGAFLAAGVIVFLLWFGAFAQAAQRTPLAEIAQVSRSAVAADVSRQAAQHYWSMLFAEGFWRWLASDGKDAALNPLSVLTPLNPVLYSLAFLLYAAAFGFNLWQIARRPSRTLAVLFLLAFAPGLFAAASSVVSGSASSFHARHLYGAAPFFYLFLAHGWSSLARAIRRAAPGNKKPGDGHGPVSR